MNQCRDNLSTIIGISIESLMENIKYVFRIDPLLVPEFHMISAIILISVLLYHIMVYYTCNTDKSNPKSIIYAWGRLTGNSGQRRWIPNYDQTPVNYMSIFLIATIW
jgi:hypothetical protein